MYAQDEQILYECYQIIAQQYQSSAKAVDKDTDKSLLRGIVPKASLSLMRLTEEEHLPAEEIQENVICAKDMFMQYLAINGRNPSCISAGFSNLMERLVRAVCRHEAEMISLIRIQETGGNRIDVRSILQEKKNLRRLRGQLASTVVSEVIREPEERKEEDSVVYISETGTKYHRKDCPYCRGRYMSAATKTMAENQGLLACRCFREYETRINRDNITAFIDESIAVQ